MSWLGRLLRRNALERELDKELRFHLDAAIADHMRDGLSRSEAERRARIDLGGVEQVKEEARDARGTRWLEDWWSDTRYALRGMVRSPAFSTAAVLTLAVGIGANTAVWSIVDALLLRSLPIDRPDQLYALKLVGREADGTYIVSHPEFRRLAPLLPDSTRLAAMTEVSRMYATIGESPEPIAAQLVSGNWFKVLGVKPAVGRVLSADDDRTLGGHPVVVLGAGFWRSRFAGDPGVVGRTVKVNGRIMTVIGVADEEFVSLTVGQTVAMWVPLSEQHEVKHKGNSFSDNADTEQPWVPQRGIHWLTMVTRAEASDVPGLQRKLDDRFRLDRREELAGRDSAAIEFGMREHLTFESLERGFSPLRSAYRDPLQLLMGSVGLVLLIACGNLAGLMLARASARSHEMAVRVSLGAKPGRLVRQVLTESVTLAAIGGVASLFVAKWGAAALLKAASNGPRPIPLAAGLSGRVLAFAFAVSIVTGILFGLGPALRIARADLYETFRSGGRVFGKGSHRLPLGRLLVASQMALSLVLVTSAGLLVRTFQNLLSIDPGYQADQVVTARIDVRAAGYTYAQLPALHDQLLRAVGTVPGVKSASLSLIGLASGASRISGFTVPGRELPPSERSGQEDFVTPEFFATVGMPILRGRTFTASDRSGAPRVVVINQSAARHFFGTDDVVGKRIGYGSLAQFEVIGVVADARVNNVRRTPRMLYQPLAQGPQEFITSIEARLSGAAASAVTGIRSAVGGVDRNLPLREVTTLQDLLHRGLVRERLIARLAGSFGVLALLLAGIGLYGVIAYSVARRTNEMGVRLALGSSPAGVSWLVMHDSLLTIVLGLGAGVALWYPLRRFTEKLLYNVAPGDVATVALAVLLLALVGAFAALLPALRASRVDPVEAIRAE